MDSAVINEQIDKAANILNSMMEEIHQEAFVSGAVSEITGVDHAMCIHACIGCSASCAQKSCAMHNWLRPPIHDMQLARATRKCCIVCFKQYPSDVHRTDA